MSTEFEDPVEDLHLSGDVVERQSFLNGTRAYTIVGEGGADGGAWSWTLTLTLPREEGEPLTEGDLSLELGGRNWEAALSDGAYRSGADDPLEAATVHARCHFVRTPDAESSLAWPAAEAELTIGLDSAELTLHPL
ncbi:MAG TPA: hypothetical protein VFD32_19205 [Dehalococcoidia bacterium]|nr:hypothetical protein [Dehalococcoidia bacterium]